MGGAVSGIPVFSRYNIRGVAVLEKEAETKGTALWNKGTFPF